MTLNSLLSEQQSAKETAFSSERRHSLSTSAFDRLKAFLLSDSYAFAQIICGHQDLIPELHMPLSYMACGLTDKLIVTLDAKGFDSYVTRQLRKELWKRKIDWTTSEGRRRLDAQLDFLNIRWCRGTYKSSTITHAGGTFLATVDPNITAKITHATDDKAWEFCSQISDTVLSGIYQDFFPERIPPGDITKEIGQKKITLGGRTVSRPQTTIQASGYLTKDTGGHYDLFLIDDLVMERNSSPDVLRSTVHPWLRNIEGYYIEAPGVRVRRIHVGTKWDEDDDDHYLTSGKNATSCLTIRVPIEEYEGDVENILQAGTPTIPQMFPAEKIAEKKARVINGEEDGQDADGARSWRCNYLLDAYAGDARIFAPSVVDDINRWWMGPYEHKDKGKFLVARYKRDGEGKIVHENDKPRVLVFDPWKDLDRVATVDPSWADGGDNWAVSAVGGDYEAVKFQLQTLADDTGMEGWIEALAQLDELYHFRQIGFDGGAYQDVFVQNLIKTNPILRRMRNRMTKVPHKNTSKKSRMRQGLAEPLKMYKFLLDPTEDGQATRDELKAIRGAPNDKDGIADSLSMAPAVLRRKRSPEDREEADAQAAARERMRRRTIDPALGVPFAA